MRRIGIAIVAVWAVAAALAPWLAPNSPADTFRQHLAAPPMMARVVAPDGGLRAPFVYPLRLVNRLERRFEEDRARPVTLSWFAGGRLVGIASPADGPWLPLGADSYGRCVASRLLFGARVSLGVALVAVFGALLIGGAIGALSGYLGGVVDEALMRTAELVLVLPSVYLLLALRAVLPLVLPPASLFVLMSGILALVGWPMAARGVRAIVAAEASREYVVAARSLGAGHARVLFVHLLPAARPFLATQAALLLPAFILAEAVLSFVGFGFVDPTPSWGAMLHDAADVTVIASFPWCLSPAAAIVSVVFGMNLLVEEKTGRCG